jgi:hypothetical protein
MINILHLSLFMQIKEVLNLSLIEKMNLNSTMEKNQTINSLG